MDDQTAIRRATRAIRRSQDYQDNIERRLRRRKDYQRSSQRVSAAFRNQANDPQEYRDAYRENADMYRNTAYSRSTYMKGNITG